jgi:4-amino-4-deoxy-L-arabinose transferase-like glycosyltransferase
VAATTTESDSSITSSVIPAPRRSAEGAGAGLPGSRTTVGWLRRHRLLLSVLATALGVRLWGITANLPVIHHPDEPLNIRVIEGIAAGDLNPHFFNYPSLFLYLQAAVSLDGPVFGWILPGDRVVLPTTKAMGTTFAPSVSTVLVHQLLSVAFGVALVAVVWAIARKTVGGTVAPAVAAGLVALSPNLIEHSRFVTPDVVAALFMGLGVLAALHVLESGSMRSYVIAGLVVGLATSAKYNAALVGAAVAAACLVRFWRTRDWNGVSHLVLAGNAAVGAFLLTTPYALLDRATFLRGVQYERAHYATGHAGMQGDTPAFYAGLLFREETAIAVPGLVGVILVLAGTRLQRQYAAVVLAFPLLYCAFVFLMPVRNDRTIMVVLPLLAVFAGYAVSVALGAVRAASRQPGRSLPWQRPVAAVGAGLLLVAALVGLWGGLTVNSQHDAKGKAALWVSANLPAGSSVLVEAYSPWIDPQTYQVTGTGSLRDAEVPLGTEYIVASEAMFGRYTGNADEFPAEAAAYERLFASLELLREFPQEGHSVRIYAVPPWGVLTGLSELPG